MATSWFSERRIIPTQSFVESMSLKPITFKLSDKELHYLEVMAKKRGLSCRSEFLRSLIRSSMVTTDLNTGTHWTDVRSDVPSRVPTPDADHTKAKASKTVAKVRREPTGFDRLMIERFIKMGLMSRDEDGTLWEADEESKGLIIRGKKPQSVKWSLFKSR